MKKSTKCSLNFRHPPSTLSFMVVAVLVAICFSFMSIIGFAMNTTSDGGGGSGPTPKPTATTIAAKAAADAKAAEARATIEAKAAAEAKAKAAADAKAKAAADAKAADARATIEAKAAADARAKAAADAKAAEARATIEAKAEADANAKAAADAKAADARLADARAAAEAKAEADANAKAAADARTADARAAADARAEARAEADADAKAAADARTADARAAAEARAEARAAADANAKAAADARTADARARAEAQSEAAEVFANTQLESTGNSNIAKHTRTEERAIADAKEVADAKAAVAKKAAEVIAKKAAEAKYMNKDYIADSRINVVNSNAGKNGAIFVKDKFRIIGIEGNYLIAEYPVTDRKGRIIGYRTGYILASDLDSKAFDMSKLPKQKLAYRTTFRGYKNTSDGSELANDEQIDVFVDGAENQVGTVGKGKKGNDTIYGKWYGNNNEPWCAQFVSFNADQAGILGTTVPKFQSTSEGMNWYKENGRYGNKKSYEPKEGDIIFLDGHTGIVRAYDPATRIIYTIEGNVNNSVVELQRDIRSSKVLGFGINGGTTNGEIPEN